jgi:hypothetical protein
MSRSGQYFACRSPARRFELWSIGLQPKPQSRLVRSIRSELPKCGQDPMTERAPTMSGPTSRRQLCLQIASDRLTRAPSCARRAESDKARSSVVRFGNEWSPIIRMGNESRVASGDQKMAYGLRGTYPSQPRYQRLGQVPVTFEGDGGFAAARKDCQPSGPRTHGRRGSLRAT